MSAQATSDIELKSSLSPMPLGPVRQLLLFALICGALLLLHVPLLRLPYFWDEAGYYIPAAHDLYVDGALVPHSTVSNAHPPLVMAWLALAWRMLGFSPLVTRVAMLMMAAFALLGLFRLARVAANVPVAIATVSLVSVYPVFFSQSSLAHLDVAAAGFTFCGLSAWVEDRPIPQVVWFALAALTKETAILAPLALFAWETLLRVTQQAASLQGLASNTGLGKGTPSQAAEKVTNACITVEERPFRDCVRTAASEDEWPMTRKETSPGGTSDISPALQRGESENYDASPGGTTEFSRTHFRAAQVAPNQPGLQPRSSRFQTPATSSAASSATPLAGATNAGFSPCALLSPGAMRFLRSFPDRLTTFFFPKQRKSHPLLFLTSLLPLAAWYGFHYSKTGYLLGNPEFVRYNVTATFDVVRIPIALALRLWQMFGYFGLWLLTLAGLLAMTRKPQSAAAATQWVGKRRGFWVAQRFSAAIRALSPSAALAAEVSRDSAASEPVSSPPPLENRCLRPRISLWVQGAFFSLALAYVLFMAIIGGAALARYMLPVLPLMMMVLISTLWRRVRHWYLIVAMIAVVFVAGLFHNPPYSFSLEDNLAYRDFVRLHVEAIDSLHSQFPHSRVLTAWPASDELNRPWLAYVSQPMPVVRIEDFTAGEIARAAAERDHFDVALVFSTKYEPEHPMLENWNWWRQIKERYFGYHRDLKPEQIAMRLGGTLLFRKEMNGQWVGVIGLKKAGSSSGT